MHSRRILGLLVAGLSAMTVVEATFINPRMAGQNGVGLQRRQGDGGDGDGDQSAAQTSAPPPTESPSPPPTPTPSDPSTSPTRTSPTTSPTTTPTTTSPTRSPTSTPPSRTTPPPPNTTQPPPDDNQDGEDIETITQIITRTRDDGSLDVITTQSTITPTPGLAGGGNNQPSGMTEQTRNTVIGVVVGVGGAIILGGLAFVAWRIWGRKKAPEEHDHLMDYHNSPEKPDTQSSVSGRTPFQSTLESYHAPTQVNTASNF